MSLIGARIAFGSLLIIAVVGLGTWVAPPATAQPPDADEWATTVLADRFTEIHKLIKPQPGESRWMEIEWQTSLWTAREMAARQGKPIFLWYGSGGSPACHT